jgi:hypothetical protein
MSLDNIQLPPDLVQHLYKKSLVDLETSQSSPEILNSSECSSLGKNEKNILIIVEDNTVVFLPDEELQFLMGILGACKLSMADVALVNFYKNPSVRYEHIMQQFRPDKILFFGIDPASLGFPLAFPDYQLQKYNGQVYLSAPALNVLSVDKTQKMQLWNCLKNLFEIA